MTTFYWLNNYLLCLMAGYKRGEERFGIRIRVVLLRGGIGSNSIQICFMLFMNGPLVKSLDN